MQYYSVPYYTYALEYSYLVPGRVLDDHLYAVPVELYPSWTY